MLSHLLFRVFSLFRLYLKIATTVPVTITWKQNANEVILAGSFLNNWQDRVRMERKDGIFVYNCNLEKAKHYYKYIVDGIWRHDETNPKCEKDPKGNINNFIDCTNEKTKDIMELDINQTYWTAKPPPDQFDLNPQTVPIHFTKNILNCTQESKLSENNVHYQYSDGSENLSFKYYPPPPHVILYFYRV